MGFTGLDTGFPQKNKIFIFVVFDVLFVVRHILVNYRSQGLPLDEQKNLFLYFIL